MAVATKTRTKTATSTKSTPKAPVGKKRVTASPAKTPTTAAVRTAAKKTTASRGTAKASTAPAVRTRKTSEVETPAPAKTGRRGGNAQALAAKQKGKVKIVRNPRVLDETTGFVPGTDSHIIAEELLKGGVTRAAIIERLRGKLNPETRNGTPKSIANVVASTYAKMVARGYTVEASYKLNTPTPASKRAATRRANASKK